MYIIKTTYIHLLLIISAMVLLSCEKLIEVSDPINQITRDQVFTDLNTANAALDNLYMEMQANSMFGGRGLGALMGAYTDDLDAHFQPSSLDNLNIYFNQIVPSNAVVLTLWNNAYKEIYTANAIIKGIDESTGISVNDKRRVKGEALLIRTMVYFHLQRIFGDVPYTIFTDFEVNRSLFRMPSSELYEKLHQDIATAVELLEDNYRNAERIYLNKKAAQLVQANMYLTIGKFQAAEEVCRTILATSIYSIQQDLSKVFKKNGNHIIWQLKPLNANQSVPETGIFYFTAVPPPAYSLTANLVNSFEDTDLRKIQWITKLQGSGTSYFRNEKYKNFITNTDEYSIVMRIEELYFILAEALVKQDKLSEASSYLNMIRTRSGLSPLTNNLDKDGFIVELLKEKRREFFTEQGMRFFDLKRNARLNTLNAIKPNWKSFHQLWPIPQAEMLLNPNLKPQNQDY